ncbi:glutathione peroxidase [Usitatibacter palustris]|uniref:Glutathione peroxidase n=1 Tax=Usitatibacter palustris TaxID=2732487 RepID=A0A6M4H247_9PROT|nr:glutathione peroxidase [Usitatibacter palustris]QJR13609.1 Hydroperoxy fatty acid reductase gpx1 [Usitatibacter palustris]
MNPTLRLLLATGIAAASLDASAACPSLLDHKLTTLQGKSDNLCRFEGQVVLLVNTASYCGYTKQYEGLEGLYQKYKDKGLVVLGFPSNDFGKQEPGSNAEVADFCERTFKVRFPMYEKSPVAGKDANPIYKELAEKTGEAPKWNFHKYLVGRDGKVLANYGSKVTPDDPKLVAAVEAALQTR